MDQHEIRRRCRNLFLWGLAVLGAVVIFYILGRHGLGIPCPIRLVTGWNCPGCGNSRAALALLKLDFREALSYNLLFPLEFGYLAWVLFRCALSYLKGGRFAYRPTRSWPDIVILTLILLWWPVRNLI